MSLYRRPVPGILPRCCVLLQTGFPFSQPAAGDEITSINWQSRGAAARLRTATPSPAQNCVCVPRDQTILYTYLISVQFGSVQSLDRLGRREDKMGDSAEILYQSFQREVIEGRTDMGRDLHSLTLSTEHFLCRPRRRNRLPPPFLRLQMP